MNFAIQFVSYAREVIFSAVLMGYSLTHSLTHLHIDIYLVISSKRTQELRGGSSWVIW